MATVLVETFLVLMYLRLRWWRLHLQQETSSMLLHFSFKTIWKQTQRAYNFIPKSVERETVESLFYVLGFMNYGSYNCAKKIRTIFKSVVYSQNKLIQ